MVSATLPAATARQDSDSKTRLRLWIRLLRASRLIEGVARERLKSQFNATLPRFDVMAALYRKPEGMLMSEISRFLMVSNGNVTGVVSRLIEDAWVTRTVDREDRRSATVRLTRKGRESFLKMAAANERWMDGMFADLTDDQIEDLMGLLTHVRLSLDAHPL